MLVQKLLKLMINCVYQRYKTFRPKLAMVDKYMRLNSIVNRIDLLNRHWCIRSLINYRYLSIEHLEVGLIILLFFQLWYVSSLF